MNRECIVHYGTKLQSIFLNCEINWNSSLMALWLNIVIVKTKFFNKFLLSFREIMQGDIRWIFPFLWKGSERLVKRSNKLKPAYEFFLRYGWVPLYQSQKEENWIQSGLVNYLPDKKAEEKRDKRAKIVSRTYFQELTFNFAAKALIWWSCDSRIHL